MNENIFDPYDHDDEHLFGRVCDECGEKFPCYCNHVDDDRDKQLDEEE